tara:strand:- start:58 stop:249 length:192 start_codon:yes stop_codon:yes gene_type:complete
MQRIKEVCDRCSREYLKELMKKTSSKPAWLCLRCVNQDSRLKVAGLKQKEYSHSYTSGLKLHY